MKKSVQESIKTELWLINKSRKIGSNDGEEAAYLALKSWLSSCEDYNLATQVVDNALLSERSWHKISISLRCFQNDYNLVMQRIKSDAKPDDKPAVVRKVKAKGQRAKRITGDGPRPETP